MDQKVNHSPPWGIIARVTILSIAVGLASGVIGAVSTENYLADYKATLNQSIDRKLLLAEEKPRPLPGTFEEAATRARETLLPSLVQFFPKGIENGLTPGTQIGAGIVVTSDGWIVTTETALGAFAQNPKGLIAYVGNTAYPIEEVFRDPTTGMVMINLDANGLAVVPFGASDDVEGGDLAFIAVGDDGLLPTSVITPRSWLSAETEGSSEQFMTEFLYADDLVLPGVPVSNSAGDLIAIGHTPLHQLQPVIRSIIRTGEVERVFLGINYIDLHVIRGVENLSREFKRGAYVTDVLIESPAQLGGIEKEDILLRIGDDSLSGTASLSELLLPYQSGDIVTFVLDRAGEEIEVEVELKGK